MKRKDQNNAPNTGYPQPNGYAQNAYPAGAPYQGYQAPQGYAQPQGYPQNQGYPQAQGYSQQQGYAQPQGYTAPRNYQTPQVTGSQQPVSSGSAQPSYTGQGSFAQNGYPQQNAAQRQGGNPAAYAQQTSYTQPNAYQQPAGYPQQNSYTQPNGYAQPNSYTQPNAYQQPGSPSGNNGYGYQGGQAAAGSYIPQTPYSQGYTSPGYQAGGYAQGYNAYNQMGRAPQAPNYPQERDRNVPLNGGGYYPQPVPVRKQPFVLTDLYLLILSALLLGLFVLGMWVMSPLKWVFLGLDAAAVALLWIKPMTDSNKRLCFTIVFVLLAALTIFSILPIGGTDPTNPTPSTHTSSGQTSSGQNASGQSAGTVPETTPKPSVTNTPEPNADYEVLQRLRTFFDYWAVNRQDDMLTLCSPSWASKEDNPKAALFTLLRNRTPKNMVEENISGTSNDLSRTVTVVTEMDRNNGKPAVKYRMNVMMDKESDGQWYVNPKSLLSYDDADTPDPNITNTPAPTEEPKAYPSTILYYNPGKGEYYHLDPNCKRIAEKYLPLQGHFTYAEINDEKYKKLKPCSVCGSPLREQ